MDREVVTLAGGCFWCLEAVFQDLKGVVSVESGYSGGHVENPSYKDVCSGTTGHAEAVQITFDPAVVSLDDLLEVFFALHDPTTLNRQGADTGTQYRSAIFYRNPGQRAAAEKAIRNLTEGKAYAGPIVTELAPFRAFYRAEAYHQNYYRQNPFQPYCQMVISPKLAKLQKLFKDRLVETGEGGGK
ncbi:MAG: peptide-methionine (S)-S-oxide reductase MsrA [Acidobacteriota bacterium]